MGYLKGKNVIITGASSGIGLEVARILIREYGCTVLATGRSREKLEKCRLELGEKYLTYSFDVSLEAEWIKFADYLKGLEIKFNVLINNAGVMPPFGKITRQETADKIKVIETDFLSCVYGVDHLLGVLEGDKGVVNVSSSSALCPVMGQGTYSAAKVALKAYTEVLWAESEFYVGLIMPGVCQTDIFRSANPNEKEKGLIGKIATKPHRCAKRIVRAVNRKRKRRIIGLDARLMRMLHFFFPKRAAKIIGWFLKKSGLKLFADM